jgi:hypothetical protein
VVIGGWGTGKPEQSTRVGKSFAHQLGGDENEGPEMGLSEDNKTSIAQFDGRHPTFARNRDRANVILVGRKTVNNRCLQCSKRGHYF